MKTTCITHSADFDGIFCQAIARKFLPPDTTFIGWDFKDEPLPIPDGQIYIMDLPVDRVFDCVPAIDDSQFCFLKSNPPPKRIPLQNLIWIDHHCSSIESHPTDIPGYRIDGVAACRLAWQWFTRVENRPVGEYYERPLPEKGAFIERTVSEPLAARLAGEYDIWDKRDPRAELFQHGLRSEELHPNTWDALLSTSVGDDGTVARLLNQGRSLQWVKAQENASIIKDLGFTIQFEGLTFLACNHARYNSFLFTAGLTPEHDACFGFKWNPNKQVWSVSLYHAPGKERHDLSLIAVKHGGGGHRGACGFETKTLPFLP